VPYGSDAGYKSFANKKISYRKPIGKKKFQYFFFKKNSSKNMFLVLILRFKSILGTKNTLGPLLRVIFDFQNFDFFIRKNPYFDPF